MARTRFVRAIRSGIVCGGLLFMVPVAALAQSAIIGVARDTSGAVLPGVTVEAASDVLIEKVKSATTDANGSFRIGDLRPGTYVVTFTMPGFNTYKLRASDSLWHAAGAQAAKTGARYYLACTQGQFYMEGRRPYRFATIAQFEADHDFAQVPAATPGEYKEIRELTPGTEEEWNRLYTASDRYGEPPAEVDGLLAVARLRRRAAQAGLADVVAMGPNLRIAPANLPDSLRVRLQRLYPKAKLLAGGDALVVPLPTAGGEAVADADLIAWVRQLLDQLWPEKKAEPAVEATA